MTPEQKKLIETPAQAYANSVWPSNESGNMQSKADFIAGIEYAVSLPSLFGVGGWVRATAKTPPMLQNKKCMFVKYKGEPALLVCYNMGWYWSDNSYDEGFKNPVHKSSWEVIEWYDPSLPSDKDKEIEGLTEALNEKDFIIHGLNEGAENWEQEYKDCRRRLQELVDLKELKDTEGKTEDYLKRQPEAWQAAKEFLSKYTHIDY